MQRAGLGGRRGRPGRRSTSAAAPRRCPTGGRRGGRRGRRCTPLGVGHDQRREPGARRVDAGPAELGAVERLAGEGLDHARPAHEGVGVLGHHDVVGQAEEQGGAGHHRARGREQHRDAARAASPARGRRCPSRAAPRPRRARRRRSTTITPSSGRPAPRACSAASAKVWPSASDSAPRRRSSVTSHEDHLAPGDRGDLRRQRPRVVGRDGDGEGHVDAATLRVGRRLRRRVHALGARPLPSATTPDDRLAEGAGRGREQPA